MSLGESFLQLVNERFYPDGLFILDEPEGGAVPDRAARPAAPETEHYRLTRAFLQDPDAFLRHLFAGA